MKWVIGIDEVGRGALAGPLVVAVAVFPKNYGSPTTIVAGWDGRDSKRLSPAKRETIASVLQADPRTYFAFAFVSPARIDRIGMTAAASLGVSRALAQLSNKVLREGIVLLDGGLSAPSPYRHVTVIRGDEQLSVIAAASIVAKVYRDRLMRRAHQRFPQYGFNEHKGYGTRAHYRALRAHGPSAIHRRSFCLERVKAR